MADLHVRMSDEQMSRLERQAEAEGRTVSGYVRWLVERAGVDVDPPSVDAGSADMRPAGSEVVC